MLPLNTVIAFFPDPACSSVCGMSVAKYEMVYSEKYAVQNIFTRNYNEPGKHGKGYWLGGNQKQGWFIIDLGCTVSFGGIQLINVHNEGHKDRSTKKFR